jgi:glycosyltransferase involved in cell wall biosynthesis
MGRRSDRGLLRHLAYFVEACFLLGVVRRQGVEHMHVHFGTNPTAVARLIRCLGGPRYSFTVHGPDEFDAPRQLDLAGKVADAAFVVAISDYGAAQLRRWVPLDHWPKIQVVHCTVGEDFFREARPIDPASETLVCVGRLCPQKGHLVLIDALARLVSDGVDARLVLAGDGELRQIIEQRIRELDLLDRVEITGWIDEAEVRRRILAARALVLPSFAEGLPMVLMEALALGRPVISTYVAGIPELVRPGENGWLVPAGNVVQLAAALRSVLTTPADVLDAMAQAGRACVQERHSTVAEGARLERLFVAVQEVHAHENSGRIFRRGALGATAAAAAGV